ncbi:hypothetical protein Rt10032_c11g4664 [Rhodotorula toruloides]|uniref:protein-tyrosine-phosphatase n=1 Tax=Rhodotorula toruloides TaxID=5286 RepID=A0A511KJT7_RHOTO|nr:hypothetical protein Rt10032_c11g4664 [Rhodotorula toruloides]
MLNRPRLSPKSPNEIQRDGGYFVPPTPAAADRAQPAWSLFFGGQAGQEGAVGRVDENGEVARAGCDAGSGVGGAGGLGGANASSGMSASARAGQAEDGPSNSSWSTTAPPSFTLSPTSTAFNAKFSHALRVPSSSNIPQTPLYLPPSSPFIPENAASTRPAAASSPGAVPPTPGPSTTSGLSFPPPSSSNSPFKLPTSLAFAGRKPVTPRPGALASTQRTASALPIPISSQRYTLYTPQTVFSLIHSARSATPDKPPPILVLDIRTHTAFVSERLAGSINVCVPSTLLRRPGFGIDRVADSLPPSDQEVFERWNSCGVILVIDQESTALVQGGGPASLLAKFDKAGFEGKLGWVKGGWYAIRTQLRGLPGDEQEKLVEVGQREVTQSPATASAPVSAHSTPFGQPGPSGAQTSALDAPTSLASGEAGQASTYPPLNSKKHGRPVLQVRDLPASAFQLASTSAFRNSSNDNSRSTSRAGPPEVISPSTSGGSLSSSGSQRPNMGKRRRSGNEGFVGLGESYSSKPPGGRPSFDAGGIRDAIASSRDDSQVRTSANPFFDNIRQNSEALSLERSLANLAPVDLPSVPPSLIPSLPSFLRTYLYLSPMSRADRLARQFYELEFAERERLEGTFKWHSRQSAVGAREAVEEREGVSSVAQSEESEEQRWEKFGISAGVELGNLNRFRNIFPYEHARVRLQHHSPSATDYVNASYLSLRDSSKRFVASQGPLPTTFRDFWQMCDQENVGVIIMLTNLQEGGRDKCGRYWASEHEGEWDIQLEGDLAREEADRLKALEAKGGQESTGGLLSQAGRKNPGAGGGGFFSVFDAKEAKKEQEKVKPKNFEEATLRSTITVRRRRQHRSSSTPPPPRKIRHIQYRAWPDFDIPAEPADVVSLVNEVEAAQRAYMQEMGWDPKEHNGLEPPILAHCSAGVGRTGVFIMVSSLLAKLRQDHEAATQGGDARADDGMDIDPPSVATPPTRPPLAERLSDPETEQLSTGLSLSSLDGPAHSPSPLPSHPGLALPRLESRVSSQSTSTTSSATLAPIPTSAGSVTPASPSPIQPSLPPLDVPALAQQDPIFAGVNELREQRMSMVANYRQYVSVLECVLEGAVRLLSQGPAKS